MPGDYWGESIKDMSHFGAISEQWIAVVGAGIWIDGRAMHQRELKMGMEGWGFVRL
jgi:hypothetical protein